MRSNRRIVTTAAALGTVLGLALVAPPSPAATSPDDARAGTGAWTKISSGSVANIAEPGLYRTADRVLHVVYHRQSPTTDDLAFTTIDPTGVVTGTGVAVGGWAGLPQDPKLVDLPGGGMRLVFGGLRTTTVGDPYGTGQMFSATADAAGSTWTLQPGALTESPSAYASYGTGATTLADGTPVVAFPLNSTLTWNAGGTDQSYTVASGALYHATLARDGDQVWAAFAANGSSASTAGLFVKQLLPTVGTAVKVPQSSEGANTVTPSQATAFVARPGGGLYVAECVGYPTCDGVGVWRVGSDAPVSVPGSAGARNIAMSTSPDGRLWIAWTTYDEVKVVHTRASGLRFSTVHTIRPPKAAEGLYGLAILGSDGPADLVLNGGVGLFHRNLLPSLTLKAVPNTWRAGERQRVVFTVTDVKTAVAGARVRASGKSCTTSTAGTCSITFGATRPRTFTATARHPGYTAGQVVLTVR